MRSLRPSVTICPAKLSDIGNIHDLLADSARAGLVLPRPTTEIRHHLADFLIAYIDDEIAGCISLRDYGKGLFEVRSLVVEDRWRGRGIGSALVKEVVDLANSRGAHSLFALTYHPHLFQRLGFRIVPKELFPQKVWTDCRYCAKQHCCDEIALVLDLGK